MDETRFEYMDGDGQTPTKGWECVMPWTKTWNTPLFKKMKIGTKYRRPIQPAAEPAIKESWRSSGRICPKAHRPNGLDRPTPAEARKQPAIAQSHGTQNDLAPKIPQGARLPHARGGRCGPEWPQRIRALPGRHYSRLGAGTQPAAEMAAMALCWRADAGSGRRGREAIRGLISPPQHAPASAPGSDQSEPRNEARRETISNHRPK